MKNSYDIISYFSDSYGFSTDDDSIADSSVDAHSLSVGDVGRMPLHFAIESIIRLEEMIFNIQ